MNENRVLLGELLANNKEKISGRLLELIVWECNSDMDLFDEYRVYDKYSINDILYGMEALDIINLAINSDNLDTNDDLFRFTENSIESLSKEDYQEGLMEDFDIIVDAISENESSFSLDLYELILALIKDRANIESK